jgi:hypothetical protein
VTWWHLSNNKKHPVSAGKLSENNIVLLPAVRCPKILGSGLNGQCI